MECDVCWWMFRLSPLFNSHSLIIGFLIHILVYLMGEYSCSLNHILRTILLYLIN